MWCVFFSLFLFVCLLSSSFRIYMYLEYKREREKEKEKWMLTVALKSFLINRFKNGNDHKNVYLPSSHREKKKKGTRDFRGLTDFFFFFLIWRICNFFFTFFGCSQINQFGRSSDSKFSWRWVVFWFFFLNIR